MARKKKVFDPSQQAAMIQAGLDWRYFELVYDASQSMMVKNLLTGETLLVRKILSPKYPRFRMPQ